MVTFGWTRQERYDELDTLCEGGWDDFYFFAENRKTAAGMQYGIAVVTISDLTTRYLWNYSDVSDWVQGLFESAGVA